MQPKLPAFDLVLANHDARAGARAALAAATALVPQLQAEAAIVDVDDGFPAAGLALLREKGLLSAPVPKEHGGAGLGEATERFTLLQVLAQLGRGSLPVGRIYEGHVNALALIKAFAGPAQAAAAFGAAASGHLFGVWNTQAADGLTLGARCGERIRLEGCKTFASGAGFVSRALVTAHTSDGGLQMVLVAVDSACPAIDRSFWRPLGMRSSASYKVNFGGLTIGQSDLIGLPGDYLREPAFSGGAVRFAAVQQGGIEAVFDETRRFLRALKRTIDPHQQARVGEMAMLVASGRQWLQGAAQQALDASPVQDPAAASARVVAYAHLMRTAIESNGLRVLQLAERCIGARGLMSPEPFERMHRDLTHYLRQAGPDAAVAAAGQHALASTLPAHALWTA